MQEFDLYGDLELQHAEEKQKATEDLKWKDKYEVALSTIEKLQVEKKELNKKIKQLETNFASLFETARTEIKRKDSQICELRKQKDDICFRRTKPQFAGRQFNENETVHRSVSSERNHKNPFSGEPRKIISSNTVQSEQFSDDKIPSIFENGKHNFDKINSGEQTARNLSHGKDSIRDRHRNHSKDPEDRSRNRNQSRDRIDDRNRSRHRVDGQNRSTDRVDERNRSQDRKDDRDRSRDRANERDRNRDRSRDRLDGRNRQRFDDRNDTKYRDRLEHRKSKKSKSSHKEEKKHDKKRKRHARDNSETKSSDINWDKTDEIDDSHSQRINYTNNEEKSKSSSSRHEQTKPRDLCNKLNNDHTKAQNNDAKIEQNQPKNVPSLQKEKEPKIEILQIEILKDVKELKKNKLKAEKMPKPDPIDPAKVAIEKSNQLLDAIFDDSMMNKSEDPNDDGLLYDNLLVSTQKANPIPDANKKQDLIKTDENSNLNFQTPQRHNNTKLIHELFGSSPAGSLCSVVRKRNSVVTLGDSSSDSDFIPIMNDVRIEKGERTQLAITPKVPIVEQIVIDDSLSENDRTIEKECFEMKPPKNPVRVAANQAENNETEILDDDLLAPFKQINSNSENKKFTPKTDENFNLKQHKTTPQKQLSKKFMDDLFGSSPGGSVCGQKYSPSMDESSSDFYFEPNMKHVNSQIDEKTSPNMPIIIDDNYTDDVIRTHNEISHEVKELKQAVAAPSSTEKTVTENVKQLLGLDSSFYSSEDDEIYEIEKLKLNTAGQDIQSPAFEQITPRKHVETVEKSKPNTSNEKSGERPPNSFVQSTNKGNDFQNTCKTSLPENQYQSIINNQSLERNIHRKEFREKEDLKQSSQHNSSNSNSKSILDEDPNQSSISRKRKKEKHHHHGHHHHHHHKHKHRSKESTKTKSECSSQKYYKNNRNLETNRDKIVTKDFYSKDKSESTSFKNNISKARSSPILVYYDDDQLNEPPQNQKMSEQDQVFFLHCDDISSDDDEIIGKKLNSDECNKKQSNRDIERHIGKIEEIGIMEEQILNDGKKVDIKKPSEENKTEIYKTEEPKTNNKVETNKRDMNSLAFKEKPINSIVSMKDENSEEIGKETKCNEPKEEDHLLALKFKIDENPSNSMAVSVNTEEIDNTHICDVKLDLSKTKSRKNINTSSFSEDFCHINATDSDQQLTQDYHLQNLLETSDKKKDFIEIKHTDNVQAETDESTEFEKPQKQIAQETLNTHRKVEVLEKNHKVLSQEVVSTDKRNTDSLNAEQLSNDPNDAVLNVDNTEKIIASNNIDKKSSIAIPIADVIKNVSDCELVIREPVKSSCDELPVQQPTSSNEKHDQTNYHEITSKPFDISVNETLGNPITYKDEEISCRIPENMSVCSKNEPISSSSVTDENIPNAIKFYSSHVSPQKSLNSTDDLESPQSNSEYVHSGRRKKTKTPRKRSDMCKGDLNKTIQMVSDRYTKLDEVNTSTSIKSESKLKSSEVMSKLSSDKDLRVAKHNCTESELSIKTVAFNSNENNTLLLEIDNKSGEKKPEPDDNKIITKGQNGSFENEKEIVADLFPQEEKPKPKDEKKPECVSKEFTENKNSSLFISGEFPQHDETRNETIEEATLSLLKTQELLTNFPSEISFDKDLQNKNSLINKDFLKTPSPQTTTSEDQVKNSNNYVSSSELEDTEMSKEPQIEQKVISSEEKHPLPISELKEINEKCVESYSITIKRHRNKKKNIGHSTEVVGNVLIDVKDTNKTLYTVESSLEEESSIEENQRNDYLEKSINEASMDKTCNSSFNKIKTSITPTTISSKITKQMRQQHPIGMHQMMKHFMDSEHSLVGTCNYPLVIGDDTNVKKRKRNSCSSLDNSEKINETSPIYESAEVQVKRKYRNKTKKLDSTESNEDGKVLNEDHTTKKFIICQADKVHVKRKYTKRVKNLQDNSNNSEDSEVANSSISDESKISSLNDDDVNEEKSPPCAAFNKLPVKTNEDIAKVNNNCISEELRTVLNDDDDNNKKSPNSEIAKVHVKRKYTKKTKNIFNSYNSNEDIEVSSNSNISDESTTISLNDADDDNKTKLQATEHFKSPDDLKQPKKKRKYTRKHSNSSLKSINKSNESGESLDGHEIQFPLNQFESANSFDKSNSSQSIGESVDEVLHSSNATTYLGLEKSSKSKSSNSSLGSSNRANELCENFKGHENLESNSNEFCENRIESHDTPSSPSMLDSVNGSEKNPNKFNFSERTDEIVDKIFHSANGHSELCLEKSTKLKKIYSPDSKEYTEKVPQSNSESFDKIHHSSKETTEIRFEESSNNFPNETFEEFCHENTNVSNAIGTCLNNSLSGEDKEHDLTDVKQKKTKKHQKRKLSRSSDSKSEETIVESKRSKNSIEETSQSSSTTCDTTFADKMNIHHESVKEPHRSPSHEKTISVALTPTHHKIFLNDGFSNDPPPVYNANDDDLQYHEIDDRMRSMFQSPTYTQPSNSECIFDKKNNDNEHLVVDETLNNESERTQCDTSISSRKVSLGSNEYVIESTGSHTANVFITRKKSKKRTKAIVTSL